MTEILEGRGAAGRGTPSDPDGGEDRLAEPIDQVGAPFFADLVRAHYAWERQLRPGQGSNGGRVDQLGAAYVEKLGEFRDREGEIVEAYWCVRRPSAVALTEKPQTRLQHFLGEHQMR